MMTTISKAVDPIPKRDLENAMLKFYRVVIENGNYVSLSPLPVHITKTTETCRKAMRRIKTG